MVSGAVLDATKNYDLSFHVGGAMMFTSGLVFSLLHLPYFQRLSWQNLQQPETIEVVFDDDLAAQYLSQTGPATALSANTNTVDTPLTGASDTPPVPVNV